MKRVFAWAAACLILLQLTGCASGTSSEIEGVGGSKARQRIESSEMQFLPLKNGDILADIETSKGLIQVVLYPDYAPLAVENFTRLAQEGYYNGLSFHRVIEDFVVQGGAAPEGEQDKSIWGHPFASEFSDKLHHYAGALCMASVGGKANTHESQFYIVSSPQDSITEEMLEKMREAGMRDAVLETYQQTGGTPYLDYTATVFGHVFAGMDIVDRMNTVPVNEEGVPKSEIKILSITIHSYMAPIEEQQAEEPAVSQAVSSEQAISQSENVSTPESIQE